MKWCGVHQSREHRKFNFTRVHLEQVKKLNINLYSYVSNNKHQPDSYTKEIFRRNPKLRCL